MKAFTLFIVLSILHFAAGAQRLKIYGGLTYKSKPLQGALIVVFENGVYYKKIITDRKGQFRFSVENQEYFILFYYPGMEPESYDLINHMDRGMQMIPIMMDMEQARHPEDSVIIMSRLLAEIRPEVAGKYINSVYDYSVRHRHGTDDSTARKFRDNSIRQAISERDRFANYKQDSTIDGQKNRTVTTIIGPDTYELQTNASNQKRYLKNNKPITETTYRFETSRRYEGVLKNTRDVRRFERYHPAEHVKR